MYLRVLAVFFPEQILPHSAGTPERAGQCLCRTFLYTDSEFARYIYFLVEGRYKVYGNVDSGKRILYRFCQAFSILGEMEFILGPEERRDDNSVEMVEDCVALLLDYGEIKNQLRSDPVFLFFMCENLVEKSGYFGNMQLVNNLSSAQEKVARVICG